MSDIDRIDLLLKEKGISGAQMSRDLGFSNAVYSQWKSRKQNPSVEKIEKMAEYFQVTTDYLLGLNEDICCNDIDKIIFKDRIRHIRKEEGVTITQLAAHLNKGESAVRMWELGRSNPDLETLAKLSQYFECTTDYLLGLSEYRNPEEKERAQQESDHLFEMIRDVPVDGNEIRDFIGEVLLLSGDTPEDFLSCIMGLSKFCKKFKELLASPFISVIANLEINSQQRECDIR